MSYLSPLGVQTKSGTLASIANAETTGIELIPAPGAGLLILVDRIFLNIKNGSTPWTGVANVWLIYGTTGNDQVNLASGFVTNVLAGGTANTNYMATGLGVIGGDWLGGVYGTITRVSAANSINKSVCFTCSNAVTAGNGTIDWQVSYSIIKAS